MVVLYHGNTCLHMERDFRIISNHFITKTSKTAIGIPNPLIIMGKRENH